MITDRVAVVSSEVWRLVSSTDVVWVLVPTVARSVFVRVIVVNGCGSWGDSTLRPSVTPVGLVHLREHVFPLTNLGWILHAIGLLNEEHTSVVLRSLDNFRPSSPILIVGVEVLVRLWTLWTILITVLASLLLRDLLILWLWSSICRPEPTETWTIHLFLQQVTRVGIMNVALKSLNQWLLILLSFCTLN